ncbi:MULTISPECIES: ABC transporter substrate-binding protein [unclassified Ruegeria]|uniref:ABC transporter substrate-binding protein n=1 Tax=unclassified Ruegeria TaxID=2625375 RepID=UPI001487EE27|nr:MULTISPECIES: ABC transporter substrate-binding protein [unclassified Ruegeria]NOD45959.1 ABC transporter substrate-binding protein [Ruegeria sp. HKCCD5849]NOD50741.1 ABC transporter substrate-binding protein [Ruegeria sp. HKCCD5851]NOD67557.1 ABC transporter substrate-binding protein [Ruegeria sp. HKCCD7303]NOE33143.1 ABC transporter substrate-binding protein [Ruegeria sp. HKCCD7318]
MNKLLSGAVAAFSLAATTALAADEVTLQLKWVGQAQFAGYFVAEAKGFYDEEGLDVTIKPGGPDIAPEQVIAGGGADVITTWMAAGLAARERGVPLVNIAQPFKTGGLQVNCLKSTGVETPEDFPGRTMGVWFFGNEYPFYAWMASLGIETDGADENGVTVLKQAFSADPLIQGQADCISTMTYNEYRQILQAGITPEELVTFNYLQMGFGMLEDGLYVMEENLSDPEFVDKMERFVRASMKGWKYAAENQEEAAEIVLEFDETGAQELDHQVYMMGEVAKLIEGSDGALDPADYEQTVKTLLSAVSAENPAITKQPEGAWTHQITDAALN